MAWYKTGSITCTNGATSVTGTGTRFAANARVGDGLRGLDGEWYEIVNIASETTLGIYPAYAGPTGTGTNYMIAPLQGYNKESADRLRGITDGLADIKDDVAAAEAAASEAETSAANAKASETIVANDAAEATASKNAALISQNAAKASETNAKTSETNAKASETAALASKNDAAASQTAAGTSATNAANSATAALASQNAAKTSETNAKTSETNAKASETTVAASATAAANSATTASTAATNATTANNAAQAAKTSAETFKGQAAASQTAALASENKAKAWADNAVDTPVETGKYSAKHWASKAADSAAQAGAAIGTRLNSIATAVMAVNDMLIADTTTTMTKIATGALGRTFLGLANDAAGMQAARAAIGLGNVATENVVPLNKGGTGAQDAATARTNLGLGTAATADVTVSTNDGTQGRVLRVGDHGVGSILSAVINLKATEIDDIATSGTYFVIVADGQGSAPINGNGYIVTKVYSPGLQAQEWIGAFSNARWIRTKVNSTWTAWLPVLTQGSYGLGMTGTPTLADLTEQWNSGFYIVPANAPGLPDGIAAKGGVFLALRVNFGILLEMDAGSTRRMYQGARGGNTGGITWRQVLSIGDYGIGGNFATISDNNANNLTQTSNYLTTSATVGSPGYTGGPMAGQQGYLSHYQHSNPLYATQEWYVLSTPVRRFTRAKHNGTWYDWVELLSRDNGVDLTNNQDIGGIKTLTGAQLRFRSPTAGLWMSDSSVTTRNDIWMVLNGNSLQFQQRVNGFGGTGGTSPLVIDLGNSLFRVGQPIVPVADNAGYTVGTANYRFNTVYATTGTINTSDAREKTAVAEFTADETNAAKQISKEIGVYKWLQSVQDKGVDARFHIGLTVQRAIEIMETNNLDPFAYGFICYDQWDAVNEISHVERRGYTYTVIDEETGERSIIMENVIEEGNSFPDTGVFWEYTHDETVVTVPGSPGGDRYSFRYDELNMFIAAGLNANQEALEARLAAIEAQLNA